MSKISIHVPLRGGRHKPERHCVEHNDFNPRPPTRGTTRECYQNIEVVNISIHVPLRGGRRLFQSLFQTLCYFNPRPPTRGTTCNLHFFVIVYIHFNPRPPTRGTTAKLYKIFGGFCSLFATIITKRIIRPGIAFAF